MITATLNGSGTFDLLLEQGTTNIFHIDVYTDDALSVDADLSAYSARCMFRAGFGTLEQHPALMEAHCTVADNRVTVDVYPQDSADCEVLAGWYDVEIYVSVPPWMPERIVHRIHRGAWTLDPEVTK